MAKNNPKWYQQFISKEIKKREIALDYLYEAEYHLIYNNPTWASLYLSLAKSIMK